MKRASQTLNLERFGLASWANTILVCAIIAVVTPSLYFSVIAKNQNTAQNTFIWWLEESVVSNNTQLQSFIVSNATAINNTITTIQLEITNIENVLNMTENTAIMTINGVTADNTTFNLDLAAGANMVITPDPANNRLILESTGGSAGTITSNDGTIQVTVNGSTTDLSNNGVTQLNGMTGSVIILGKDGIEVTENATSINICAPGITTSVMNLQQEDSLQAMQIMALETQNTQQAMEIQSLQTAGMTIQEMLNNTDIDFDAFNMTLLELIMQVNMLQTEVQSLQSQITNFTAASAPTGAILPWSGTTMTIPTGFLYCDGTKYDSTDPQYLPLFTVIQTLYCDGTCMGVEFAVPDLRGRTPVGQGGTQFTILGSNLGAEDVTLSLAEIPGHDHSGSVGSGGDHNHGGSVGSGGDHNHGGSTGTTGNHIHSWSVFVSEGEVAHTPRTDPCPVPNVNSIGDAQCYNAASVADNGGLVNLQTDNIGDHSHTITSSGGHSHSVASSGGHSHAIPTAGSGMAHTNIQPSLVVHYMIKI